LDVRFVRVLVSTNVGSMIRLHGVKVFDEEYADDAWYEWMVWTSPGCNFSRVVATTCQCRCYESQTTKQVLISTKTRITVLLICNSAFMSFYTSDFTIDGKMCPMMATNNRASSLLCPICVHLRQPHLSSASPRPLWPSFSPSDATLSQKVNNVRIPSLPPSSILLSAHPCSYFLWLLAFLYSR
jgi:hypothetical protein